MKLSDSEIKMDSTGVKDEMVEVVKVDRGARRKARTRQKLLDAARTLFSQGPLEETSIVEITDAADVGLGTFYNHFESKAELLKALADEYLIDYAQGLDQLIAEVSDPAVIFCLSYRYTIRTAADPAAWGIVTQMPQSYVRSHIEARSHADIEMGASTGRFTLKNVDEFVRFLSYSIIGVMGGLADESLSLELAESFCGYYLQQLGIDTAEAESLLAEPMPEPASDAAE